MTKDETHKMKLTFSADRSTSSLTELTRRKTLKFCIRQYHEVNLAPKWG